MLLLSDGLNRFKKHRRRSVPDRGPRSCASPNQGGYYSQTSAAKFNFAVVHCPICLPCTECCLYRGPVKPFAIYFPNSKR